MQRKYVFLYLAIVLSALLAGCSDPRKAQLPVDMANMASIKPVLEKLSEEERTLLMAYVMRRSIQGILPGLAKDSPATSASTIGEAIDAQRKFEAGRKEREAAEKLAQAEAKVKYEVAVKSMRELVSVSLLRKSIEVERGYSGIEMDRKLAISFMFKNNSSKDIAGVKGRIELRDLFGDKVSAFQISNDNTIKVGGSVVWDGVRSVKFSLGDNKDQKLVELGDDKFTLVWEPQTIIFSDGTKTDLP